jgi:hypothetical protein
MHTEDWWNHYVRYQQQENMQTGGRAKNHYVIKWHSHYRFIWRHEQI